MEEAVAQLVLSAFNRFYAGFLDIPNQARVAFEQRDHPESLRLSNERIALYSVSIRDVSEQVRQDHREIASDAARWEEVESCYQKHVEREYHADLAMAYLHSIRRKIYMGEWRVADYASYRSKYRSPMDMSNQLDCYQIKGSLQRDTIINILTGQGYDRHFESLESDAHLIVQRANRNLELERRLADRELTIEMFRAGFYRNRGAYLVGRVHLGDSRYRPFIIALLNGKRGLYADGLITSMTYAHNMFSSTLANFHVDNPSYHELCQFLHSIMPMRPLGLHYSTVGYNHLGKVAVMNELEFEFEQDRLPMNVAPGTPGTVAIGFCTPSSAYILKVVRDTPTSGYKWGKFDGVESVLQKYAKVHEINRTDSMLDSIIYYNLRLQSSWFAPELLEQLLDSASESVQQDEDGIVFKYLIVQRKMTPLPIYLENASQKQAETAMINLGYCIRNNAAGNIFNRDLDARNYGVSSYSKVYLFDYDALEELTEVKIRTNTNRIDGEEDIPDWYFEDGVVFLPEELITGLCLPYRELRRLFAEQHQDLLTTDYWEMIQQSLEQGKVPRVSVYPDTEKLDRPLRKIE